MTNLQRFDVNTTVEWESTPAYYFTDPEKYRDRVVKLASLIKEAGLSYGVEWWHGDYEGSGFSEEEARRRFFAVDRNGLLIEGTSCRLL